MNLKQLTIENIGELTFEDLQKPEASEVIRELIDNVRDGRELWEAEQVIIALEKALTTAPAGTKEHYEEALLPLRWQSMSYQTSQNRAVLWKKHVLLALKHGYNLHDAVQHLFIISRDDFTGGALRQQMIRALQENEERLGSRELELINEDKKMPPQIRYWLKDYEGRLSGQEARTEYHVSRYLNESPNVSQLNAEERAWLTELLGVYDFLRYYVVRTAEVRELEKLVEAQYDTNDNLTVRSRTGRSASAQSESVYGEMSGPKLSGSEILQAYRGNEDEEKAIATQLAGLRRNLTNAKERADYLWQLLQMPSNDAEIRQRVSAVLRFLAETGELIDLMNTDRRLKEAVERYALARLGNEVTAKLKNDLRSTHAVSILIRFALEGQFGLGATESARQGVKIGNILKQRGETEYQGMAFFDATTKRFTWLE